jgi:hypothetical protein
LPDPNPRNPEKAAANDSWGQERKQQPSKAKQSRKTGREDSKIRNAMLSKEKQENACNKKPSSKKASRHFPLFAQTPKAQKEEAVPQELLKRKAMLNAHGIGESQNSPEEELFPRAKADRNKTVERG